MAAPTTTTWPAEDHTLAKLAILRAYLDPWLRILGRYNDNLVYYDGFAGPGEYVGGEDGSPIVAAKAAHEYVQQNPTKTVTLTCVEEATDRANHLRSRLSGIGLPPAVRWTVQRGEFATDLGKRLDYLAARGLALAPTFAFIDPFGFKGVPFTLVKRLRTALDDLEGAIEDCGTVLAAARCRDLVHLLRDLVEDSQRRSQHRGQATRDMPLESRNPRNLT